MIRKAKQSDAKDFCNVIRTSIIKLCKMDHSDDPEVLKEWLENKTIENCEKWILSINTNTFVAEHNGNIVGIADIGHNGHLYLCYLLPEVKGLGIGKKLLVEAEKSVLNLGLDKLTLDSTLSSKGFYEHYGYVCTSNTDMCLTYTKVIK